MKKTVCIGIVLLLAVGYCYAGMAKRPLNIEEFTGTVEAFSQKKLELITQRANTTFHRKYRVTAGTQIIGEIGKGSKVKVTYYTRRIRKGLFVKIAIKIELLRPGEPVSPAAKNPLYSFPKDGYN